MPMAIKLSRPRSGDPFASLDGDLLAGIPLGGDRSIPPSPPSPPKPVLSDTGVPTGEIRISGRITAIRFQKAEEDFYIFSVQRTGTTREADRMDVKGHGVSLRVGSEVECTGVLEPSKNPRYPQPTLKCSMIMEVVPSSVQGIRNLLHHGFVKGLGPKNADALLDAYGDKLFDIAEKRPELLYTVKAGNRTVPESAVTGLVRAVREKRAVPRIMAYLAEIGLGPGLSHRVFRELGANAVATIKRDPYALTAVPLIGFTTADKVARRVGLPPNSESRIRAGMEAALIKEADNGSTAVALPRLQMQMSKLLQWKELDATGVEVVRSVPEERIRDVMGEALKENSKFVRRIIAGPVEVASLKEYVRGEKSIAKHVARLATAKATSSVGRIDLSSPAFAHLDDDQLKAVRTSLSSPFSVITGRPGCGKTTVVKSIVDVLDAEGLSFKLCAPTGRAQKRITEATGYPAATMHRMLGSRGAGVFTHDENNQLDTDVLIMDELSMVDTYLLDKTLRAVKSGTIVICVGDADQLPSIGAGNVLADLINCDKVPVTTLTQIHRQAQDSSIILNAHRIISGQLPAALPGKNDFELVNCFDPAKQVQVVIDMYKQLRSEGFGEEDIQILTPMRKKTDLGSNNLNKVMKEILNPAEGKPSMTIGKFEDARIFSVGDRIMQVANNRDLGIYNGDIGYITAIDTKAGEILCDFSGEDVVMEPSDLEDVDLAYATTIHKSQGSEFPAVIIPLAKAHSMMLDRNLLYTAETRGKKKVAMVGDTYVLKRAVSEANSSVRLTGLQDELLDAFEQALKPDPATLAHRQVEKLLASTKSNLKSKFAP
jgi:exodeoxyribonuclease V alpha subunit